MTEFRGPWLVGCGGRLRAAARVPRPAGSSLTSLRHAADPRSSEDGWRTKLGTNFTAYQLLCQIRAVWRSAQRHQGGAHRAGDSRADECRAALIPQAPRQKGCHQSAPGAVDTAFLRGGTGRSYEDAPARLNLQSYGQFVPLGRIAQPQAVVGPILFLLSPATAYMTGQTSYVNGTFMV